VRGWWKNEKKMVLPRGAHMSIEVDLSVHMGIDQTDCFFNDHGSLI
jgi:hypothetical protein